MPFSSLFLPRSLLSYLVISIPVRAATRPIAATWSDSTFGPDGPWPAVEVTLGNEQKIALFPGREFQTFLLTSDYCNHNTSIPCYANQAGLYNDARSQVDTTGSTGQIQYQSNPDYMLGVDVRGELTTSWVDTVDFGGATIENVSLSLLDESYMAYPDGTWYPLSVGCLGVGAPDTINQSFSNSYGPLINASLIPGYLFAHETVASNSFGMHIGSANPKMPGSLYFGGYDQNRIVGEVLSFEDDYTKAITLKDISIKVMDGSSPWEFESLGGLLASGNSTINSGGVQVSVDGCSPYLTLPKSTCDAIAKQLPVTYNEDLGLYFWNTDDAKYSQIVSSPSILEFVFIGDSNTQNVSISVPFRHLNLTLSAPLVDDPTPYFPCYTGPAKQFTLGRAFLQDAFVGANWGTKSWWLAQAPGPNIPSPSVVELANGGSVKASSNDWKESWSGSWTALSPEEVSSSASVTAPIVSSTSGPTNATSSDSASPPPAGLSTGAQAGIGVGVGIAGLAIIGAIAFFFLRRRKAASPDGATSGPTQQAPDQGYYAPVKNPSSPGMTETSTAISGQPPNMMYNQPYYQPYPQQYAQPYPQPFPQQYPQPFPQPYGQPYSTELPGLGNTPTELPGSVTYDTHYLDGTQIYGHISPQQGYASPHPSHSPHSTNYDPGQTSASASAQSPVHGQHGQPI
ncbi:acid protease [Hypoxylon rubiginosum]|uniref:Acid protease n=1 Tax=Hypoxylon rubiginosum TaxID=110542 RepID=A0ACC0DFR0_9PEZI|nr:acid protease [Hypoxylon rubiginosum]